MVYYSSTRHFTETLGNTLDIGSMAEAAPCSNTKLSWKVHNDQHVVVGLKSNVNLLFRFTCVVISIALNCECNFSLAFSFGFQVVLNLAC